MREAVAVVQNDIIVLQYDGWRFFSVQYPTKPAKYAKSFLYLFYRVNKRPVDYNELLLSTNMRFSSPIRWSLSSNSKKRSLSSPVLPIVGIFSSSVKEKHSAYSEVNPILLKLR